MDIIKLDLASRKRAAEVVAASFYDYPMFAVYFPDPDKRTRLLPWYLGNVLNCAIRYGEAFTTADFSGVIFILPPGHTKITLAEYSRNGFFLTPFRLGLRDYINSQACEKFVADTHEKLMSGQLHYYLWGLTVDPGKKRTGVGTALMQPLLDKADDEKMPVYLETHDQRNVAYYQRTGFELIHQDMIPKYNLDIWCMRREAK